MLQTLNKWFSIEPVGIGRSFNRGTRRGWVFTALWLIALAPVIGCGSAKTTVSGLVPVSGTLFLDGKPCPGAAISFVGIGTNEAVGAGGNTDANGKYELSVAGGEKGAIAGEYKVLVKKLVLQDGSPIPAGTSSIIELNPKNLLPAIYSDFAQTPLKHTVPAEGGTIDIQLMGGA